MHRGRKGLAELVGLLAALARLCWLGLLAALAGLAGCAGWACWLCWLRACWLGFAALFFPATSLLLLLYLSFSSSIPREASRSSLSTLFKIGM